MKKPWRLTEEKYPTNICYGCAAHGLNLIFCDMIKLETCKNIIKRVKGVIKEFRHKHMLVDMLKTMQKAEKVNCMPKLPVKIRWASMVTVLFPKSRFFFGSSETAILSNTILFSEEPEKNRNLSEVRRTLLDDTFWHESEAIASLLKPSLSAITQLEKDFPNLADACKLFFISNMKS